jgi:hypothetical protein
VQMKPGQTRDPIPDPPFRFIVVSRSQSGKTTLMIKFLLKRWLLEFYEIILFCPTFREDKKWRHFDAAKNAGKMIVIRCLKEEEVLHHWTRIRKSQINEFARNKNNPNFKQRHYLFYFDDCGGEEGFKVDKPSGVLNQLFSKGNHAGISIICVLQKLTQASTTMRLNAEAMLCFFVMDDEELKQIYRQFGTGSFKEFKQFLQYYTEQPYHNLLMNRQGPGRPRYYHNFKQLECVPT